MMKHTKKRKRLWHKHRDYVQNEVLRLVNKANRGLQPERRVTYAAAIEVANRAVRRNGNEFSSARAFGALRAVSAFIEFATRGKDVIEAYRYADLLPIGHPSSTRTHTMTASALRHARARWYAADPNIDDELRSLVASAHGADYLSPERDYLFARLAAAPRASVPLWLTLDTAEAIVAGALSLIGGNSSAARRARAQLQRRDRKGQFAFMGGGFKWVAKLGDVFRSLSGRVVGASGDDGIEFEVIDDPDLPDGIYTLPAKRGESVKAILKSKGKKVTRVAADKNAIDASGLTRKDSPTGWEEVSKKDAQKLLPGAARLWRSADGYFVEQTPDGEKVLRRMDLATNKPGNTVVRSKSWADITKGARDDQDDFEKFIEEEAAKERSGAGEAVDLDPAQNIVKQVSDAVSSGRKVRFSYGGKERIITPEKISTGEKSGKRNLLGKDTDGNTKSFTLEKIEAPGAPGPQPAKPVDVPEDAVRFDPAGDLDAQLQQAIDNDAPIAFDYNGKTRVVFPQATKDGKPSYYTNPKNGNVNIIGNETGSEQQKQYTLSKISKVAEPNEGTLEERRAGNIERLTNTRNELDAERADLTEKIGTMQRALDGPDSDDGRLHERAKSNLERLTESRDKVDADIADIDRKIEANGGGTPPPPPGEPPTPPAPEPGDAGGDGYDKYIADLREQADFDYEDMDREDYREFERQAEEAGYYIGPGATPSQVRQVFVDLYMDDNAKSRAEWTAERDEIPEGAEVVKGKFDREGFERKERGLNEDWYIPEDGDGESIYLDTDEIDGFYEIFNAGRGMYGVRRETDIFRNGGQNAGEDEYDELFDSTEEAQKFVEDEIDKLVQSETDVEREIRDARRAADDDKEDDNDMLNAVRARNERDEFLRNTAGYNIGNIDGDAYEDLIRNIDDNDSFSRDQKRAIVDAFEERDRQWLKTAMEKDSDDRDEAMEKVANDYFSKIAKILGYDDEEIARVFTRDDDDDGSPVTDDGTDDDDDDDDDEFAADTAEFDEMFTTPDGAYKPDIFNFYVPDGRVLEDADDFTDDPAILANKFEAAELGRALKDAVLPTDEGPASGRGALKFDGGDELVPAEALYEALNQKGLDADMLLAGMYDSMLDDSFNLDRLKQIRSDMEIGPDTPLKAKQTRSSITDAIRRNQDVGRPERARRAKELMDDYEEPNPAITELAQTINGLDDGAGVDDLAKASFFKDAIKKMRGTPQELEAFKAFWGLVHSLGGGDVDEKQLKISSFEDIVSDPGSFGAIMLSAIEAAFPDEDSKDILDEIYEEFGGFSDWVSDKESIADGVEDLDSGSVGALFYRLSRAAATPSTVELQRTIGVDPDDILMSTYTTPGAVFDLDARSFTLSDLTDEKSIGSMQFAPTNQYTQIVFVAAPGEVDSFDASGVSWIDEKEHLGYGTFEVVSVDKIKEVKLVPSSRDKYKIVVRRVQRPKDSDMFDKPSPSMSTDDWVQYDGQAGSNDGGFFRDPDGNEYYVKVPKSQAHAENEALAAALYELTGTSAARTVLGDLNGETRIISPLIPEATKELGERLGDDEYIAKLRDGFVVDAWLSNWDVAGLVYDNVMSDKDGNPVRVDPGGALKFRARGADKGKAFGDTVGELDTLRDPQLNPQNSRIFGAITDAELVDQANRLRELDPASVDAVVDSIVSDPDMASELKTKLRNRRADILRRILGVEDGEKNKPLTTGTKYKARELSAGDVTTTDSFVVESVFTDDKTPKGKVSVQGYFPGHESQRKEWNTETEIDVFRGGPTPPKGDKPALHRPTPPRKPSDGAFTGEVLEILRGATTWEEASRRLGDTEIVFFDYETTGLPDRDKPEILERNNPTQLGAVKLRNGEIVDRFNSYMDPEFRLSEWSAKNLKRQDGEPVTDAWLKTQPSMKEAHEQFIAWAGGGAILGGQYVPFDREILERVLREQGLEFEIRGTIDTKDIAASTLPRWSKKSPDGPSAVGEDGVERASNSLGPIATYLGVEKENWHRADADAAMAANALSEMLKRASGNDKVSTDLLDVDGTIDRKLAADAQYEADLEAYKTAKADYEAAKAVAAAWNCGLMAAAKKKNGPCDIPSVDDLIKNASVKPGETADPEGVPGGSTNSPSSMADSGVEAPEDDGVDVSYKDIKKPLDAAKNRVNESADVVLEDEDVKPVIKKRVTKYVDAFNTIMADYEDGSITSSEAAEKIKNIVPSGELSNEDIEFIATEFADAADILSGDYLKPKQEKGMPPIGVINPKTGKPLGMAKDGVTLIRPGMLVRDKNGFAGVVSRYANPRQWHGVHVIGAIDGKQYNKVTWSLTPINPGDDDSIYIEGPDGYTGHKKKGTDIPKGSIKKGFDQWNEKARKFHEQAVEDGKLPKADAPEGAPEATKKVEEADKDLKPESAPRTDAKVPDSKPETLEDVTDPELRFEIFRAAKALHSTSVLLDVLAFKDDAAKDLDLVVKKRLSELAAGVATARDIRDTLDSVRELIYTQKLQALNFSSAYLDGSLPQSFNLLYAAAMRSDKSLTSHLGNTPDSPFRGEYNSFVLPKVDIEKLGKEDAVDYWNGGNDDRDADKKFIAALDGTMSKFKTADGGTDLAPEIATPKDKDDPSLLGEFERAALDPADDLFHYGELISDIERVGKVFDGPQDIIVEVAKALKASTLNFSYRWKGEAEPASLQQIVRTIDTLGQVEHLLTTAYAYMAEDSVSSSSSIENMRVLSQRAKYTMRSLRLIESRIQAYSQFTYDQYRALQNKLDKEKVARDAKKKTAAQVFGFAQVDARDIDAEGIDWSKPGVPGTLSVDEAIKRSEDIANSRSSEDKNWKESDTRIKSAQVVRTLVDSTDIEDMAVDVVTASVESDLPEAKVTRFQYKLTHWAGSALAKRWEAEHDAKHGTDRDLRVYDPSFDLSNDAIVPVVRYAAPDAERLWPGGHIIDNFQPDDYDNVNSGKMNDTDGFDISSRQLFRNGVIRRETEIDGVKVRVTLIRAEVPEERPNQEKVPLKSFNNHVTIDVPEGTDSRVVAKAMQFAGVNDPSPATAQSVRTLIENRLLSIFAGDADPTRYLTNKTMRAARLTDIKDRFSVSVDDFAVRVGDTGRIEIVGPELFGNTMVNETDVATLVHDVSMSNFGPNWNDTRRYYELARLFIPGQGLRSTVSRALRGQTAVGQSSERDITTGGADYVFTSPTGRNGDGMGSYLVHGGSNNAQIVYDAAETFRRIDIYANQYDNYGGRRGARRKSLDESSWLMGHISPSGYEVMFKGELGHDSIAFVSVPTPMAKRQLISALKAAGVEEIGGQPLEAVITYGLSRDKVARSTNKKVEKLLNSEYLQFLFPDGLSASYSTDMSEADFIDTA